MTDPQVTTLSSVPSDSRNKTDNEKKMVFRSFGRNPHINLPMPTNKKNLAANSSWTALGDVGYFSIRH